MNKRIYLLVVSLVFFHCNNVPLETSSEPLANCPKRCPQGSSCQILPDKGDDTPIYACINHHQPYCAPCFDDSDCVDPYLPEAHNRCIARADGAGSFCATACEKNDYCPSSSICSDITLNNATERLCLPIDQTLCTCSSWAIDQQASTTCLLQNRFGQCQGTRGCSTEGLTACDADIPEEEICNDLDDNCNGIADETCTTEDEPCEATELFCDGIDNDCDGLIDEDLTPPLNPEQRGQCAGSTQQCQGALGWVPHYPENYNTPEIPDKQFADENCDGIDGDIRLAVFVAANGIDTNDCTAAQPCLTLQHAFNRAKALGKIHIYVSQGDYFETIFAEPNTTIHIFGGYNQEWFRQPRSTLGHEVNIYGNFDKINKRYTTATAQEATLGFYDLKLIAPIADTQLSNGKGLSSYVIHAVKSYLQLERVTFIQGYGANGLAGANGENANLSPANKGGRGGNANSRDPFDPVINTSSRGRGGAAGINNDCPTASAGRGGDGGTMDTSYFNTNATNGKAGQNAATFLTSSFGYRGDGGRAGATSSQAQPGKNGNAGRSIHGNAGSGGNNGSLTNNAWFANSGTDGELGQHGTGGGGAGGSGGCDAGKDDYGAGGGGGGAGGCRALTIAKGGAGGGGSFGIFAIESTLHVFNSEFILGVGGRGGDGGKGGRGQPGGAGGEGGAASHDAKAGGNGGNGGTGGHGGGAGGGSGGSVYGIYTYAPVIPLDLRNTAFLQGSAGQGGNGGESFTDGFTGQRGMNGTLAQTFNCAQLLQCR